MDNTVSVPSNQGTMTITKKLMDKKEMWAFLIGMLGQNIIFNILGASITYYFQFTLLIPAGIVSAIVTAARVWDAFNDPIMGTIVDRTRTRWGKCRPFLLFVPIPIMVVTILNYVNFGFYGVNSSKAMNALIAGWAGFMYILWGMVYTIGDIPLWGITALMTEDEQQRQKVQSLARIAGSIGGGVVLLAMQPIALAIGKALTQKIGVGLAGSAAEWNSIVSSAQTISEGFKKALESGASYDIAVKSLDNINPILAEATRQGERWGFLIIAAILAVLGTALFQLVGLGTKEKIAPSTKKYTLKDNFRIMWQNEPFRRIMISGILGSPKMLIMLAAMPLVTYYFASKNAMLALVYMVLLGGGLFAGNLGIMAFAVKLTQKYSKRKLSIWGNAIGIPPYLMIFIAYLIAPTGLTQWYWILLLMLIFFVAGASMGITTVMQTIMISDCVDYEEHKTGVRPDGIFFSGQTFIAKITMGIATGLSGLIYSIFKFSDTNVKKVNDYVAAGISPKDVVEFQPYMMALFFMVSIPPAIGSLLSIFPFLKYPLTDAKSKRILDELIVRRRNIQMENVTPEYQYASYNGEQFVFMTNDDERLDVINEDNSALILNENEGQDSVEEKEVE